jgi:hypothetical protein
MSDYLEIISKKKIKIEKGYTHFLGKDGYIWRTKEPQNPFGKRDKIGNEKIVLEKGYTYFINNEGYVARKKPTEIIEENNTEIKKTLIDSYTTAITLNSHNKDKSSREIVYKNLETIKKGAMIKFNLTNDDFKKGKAELTSLITGKGYKEALIKNTAIFVKLSAPKGQEHIGELLYQQILKQLE